MSTGWNHPARVLPIFGIINLLGNEYWLELAKVLTAVSADYKPTGK